MSVFEREYDKATRLLSDIDLGRRTLTAAIVFCGQKEKILPSGEARNLWVEIKEALVEQWRVENSSI